MDKVQDSRNNENEGIDKAKPILEQIKEACIKKNGISENGIINAKDVDTIQIFKDNGFTIL